MQIGDFSMRRLKNKTSLYFKTLMFTKVCAFFFPLSLTIVVNYSLTATKFTHVKTCNQILFVSPGYLIENIHYENLPLQYTENFSEAKIENFVGEILILFDCGYTLEPPQIGGSNEYPQSVFWIRNKKNRYTLANPIFTV